MRPITFELNGRAVSVDVEATDRLVDILRERLGRTDVKEGCGEGECGACTVLLDGQPVASCILFAWQISGRSVTTVQGIDPASLTKIQDELVRQAAVQCGFCTPGIVLSVYALIRHPRHLSRLELMTALSGHLCRCTGYERIARAVENLLEPGGQP
jgi:carbon-monoxide dehydrogenase small subunit